MSRSGLVPKSDLIQFPALIKAGALGMTGSLGIAAGNGGGKERRQKGVFVLGGSCLYACSLEGVNVTTVTWLGHSAVVLVE